MSALLAALYILCLLLLSAFALYVFAQNPRAPLNRDFTLLALALLAWVASLFAFNFPLAPETLLLVGRLNFASIVFVTTLAFVFVRAVPASLRTTAAAVTVAGKTAEHRLHGWLWLETILLGLVTLLTPLVDQTEILQAGQHSTVYGPLFLPYMLHVLILLAAALSQALRPPRGTRPQEQDQLRLIGSGSLATAAVTLVTNVLLPYSFGDFRLIHVGTLSTLLFLVAVGYAIFARHLFHVRVIIRAAFVYGGLIALALELYQLAITFLTHLLPFGDAAERGFAATAMALIVNAFTQQPVRRWLEQALTGFNHRHGRRSSSQDGRVTSG